MDWHHIRFTRSSFRDGAAAAAAADCMLALETAYGDAGEPPDAEVYLSHPGAGRYAFYLSPEAATMAPAVLQRFHAELCEVPADLHRCTQMVL